MESAERADQAGGSVRAGLSDTGAARSSRRYAMSALPQDSVADAVMAAARREYVTRAVMQRLYQRNHPARVLDRIPR